MDELKKRPDPASLVEGVIGLASLPEVCIRVTELVENPQSRATDIARIISQDAALTARLLRIVNSSFYQLPRKVDTVSRAITIIGNRELKELIIAATVASVFERISSDLMDLEDFWRHGIYCGIFSQLIAGQCGVLHAERLFVAGLIHDIGRLVLAFKLPKTTLEINRLCEGQGLQCHEAEKRVLGFDHAQVGAQLMQVWDLPVSHQYAALYHHRPLQADQYQLEAAILYLANALTHLAESGESDVNQLNFVDQRIWRICNTSLDDVEDLLLQARQQFIDSVSLFRPKTGNSAVA